MFDGIYTPLHGQASETEAAAIIEKHSPKDAVFYKMYTDRYEVDRSGEVADIAHLLELRAFSENSELRLTRSEMGSEFIWRLMDDVEFKDKAADRFEEYIFDEKQYLDIDTTRSSGCEYTATGGGRYTLPVENAEFIRVRNYIDYDNDGMAFFRDFRIVGFA